MPCPDPGSLETLSLGAVWRPKCSDCDERSHSRYKKLPCYRGTRCDIHVRGNQRHLSHLGTPGQSLQELSVSGSFGWSCLRCQKVWWRRWKMFSEGWFVSIRFHCCWRKQEHGDVVVQEELHKNKPCTWTMFEKKQGSNLWVKSEQTVLGHLIRGNNPPQTQLQPALHTSGNQITKPHGSALIINHERHAEKRPRWDQKHWHVITATSCLFCRSPAEPPPRLTGQQIQSDAD